MASKSEVLYFNGKGPHGPAVIDAATATGVGNTIKSSGYDTILIQVLASNVTTGFTVKFKGNSQIGDVDFSSAASASNPYSLIGFYDMATGSFTGGSTGLVVAADGVYELELNVDNLTSFTADVTSRTDGTISVFASLKDSKG